MGSFIELNDTLQITTEQGFPADILDLKKHTENPIELNDVREQIFEFHDKKDARIYHTYPTRCFLVHNIDGKWLYWGKIFVIEQTITVDKDGSKKTSGKYKIIKIYDTEYQKAFTKNESPDGDSYF
jgi:hypothetical protein